MGRKYPRFLYCETTDTKSEGPFIVHALPPRLICKPQFDLRRYLTGVTYVDRWDNCNDFTHDELLTEMRKWFNFSGRKNSSHPKDKIIVQLQALDFLKNNEYYTMEQAAQVINICFPTKAKTINKDHDVNRLKHLIVHLNYRSMHCTEDTLRSAFEVCGFIHKDEGLCRYVNILEKEYKIFKELTT